MLEHPIAEMLEYQTKITTHIKGGLLLESGEIPSESGTRRECCNIRVKQHSRLITWCFRPGAMRMRNCDCYNTFRRLMRERSKGQ